MSLEQTFTLILAPILRIFDPIIEATTGFATNPKTQRTVIRSFVSVAATVTLIGAAVWSYLIFYWMYVPELSISNPVWFQYGDFHAALTPRPIEIPQVPYAKVDFTNGGRYTKPLHDDQYYSALVELYVPASEKNVDIGNFMVTLSLKNSNGSAVHYSSRPAILRYRSSLLHTFSTFYRALPLLLEFSEESQRISVKMIESFVADHKNPITSAELTLSTPQLQLYSARLYLNAHLSGLRYLMYYWPISTAVSFIASFLFWEIICAVSTWRFIIRLRHKTSENIISDQDEVETTDAMETEHERDQRDDVDDGEETEVPINEDDSIPPTPTTTTSMGGPSTSSYKDGGFDTETETEASMSLYGDDEETETEGESFQEVPRGRRG